MKGQLMGKGGYAEVYEDFVGNKRVVVKREYLYEPKLSFYIKEMIF